MEKILLGKSTRNGGCFFTGILQWSDPLRILSSWSILKCWEMQQSFLFLLDFCFYWHVLLSERSKVEHVHWLSCATNFGLPEAARRRLLSPLSFQPQYISDRAVVHVHLLWMSAASGRAAVGTSLALCEKFHVIVTYEMASGLQTPAGAVLHFFSSSSPNQWHVLGRSNVVPSPAFFPQL